MSIEYETITKHYLIDELSETLSHISNNRSECHYQYMSRLSSIDYKKLDKGCWVTQALGQFNKIVQDNNFPCLFGKKAIRSELIFISICIFKSESEYADLKSILEEYTSFIKQ